MTIAIASVARNVVLWWFTGFTIMCAVFLFFCEQLLFILKYIITGELNDDG